MRSCQTLGLQGDPGAFSYYPVILELAEKTPSYLLIQTTSLNCVSLSDDNLNKNKTKGIQCGLTKHLEDHADQQRDRSNQQQQIWCSKFIKVELSLAQIEKTKKDRALSFRNDSTVGLHSLRDSLSNPDLCVQTIFLQKVSVDDRHNNNPAERQ